MITSRTVHQAASRRYALGAPLPQRRPLRYFPPGGGLMTAACATAGMVRTATQPGVRLCELPRYSPCEYPLALLPEGHPMTTTHAAAGGGLISWSASSLRLGGEERGLPLGR